MDADENIRGLKNQTLVGAFLFDQIVASFNDEKPKEELLFRLSEMNKNIGFLGILKIVQDYEADEDEIFKKLFIDRRQQVDIMSLSELRGPPEMP